MNAKLMYNGYLHSSHSFQTTNLFSEKYTAKKYCIKCTECNQINSNKEKKSFLDIYIFFNHCVLDKIASEQNPQYNGF